MAGLKFKKDYFVHYYETNLAKELTLPCLMGYFEEISLLQSEEAKVGFDYYKQNNVGWVLRQFDIEIQRLPRFGETLTIITQPVGLYKFLGFRRFDVVDSNNNTIISSDSCWLFINPQARRPVKVTPEIIQAYGHSELPEKKLELNNIPLIEREDLTADFRVRFSDIDTNRHVNNTRYAVWALEALPGHIHESYRIKKLSIEFKKEIIYPSLIKSYAQVDNTDNGLQTRHKICNSKQNLHCILMIDWIKK